MGAMYPVEPFIPDEKRPRHHAAEILALPRAERKAAIAEVPEHLRGWVRDLINDHTDKRRHRRRAAHATV